MIDRSDVPAEGFTIDLPDVSVDPAVCFSASFMVTDASTGATVSFISIDMNDMKLKISAE